MFYNDYEIAVREILDITCISTGLVDPECERDRTKALADRCDLNGGESEEPSNEDFDFGAIQVLQSHCLGRIG